MRSKTWRERVTYIAMSALVAWHAFAIMVAPAPKMSDLVQALRKPIQPYLTFFMLDNPWRFFAPVINRGTQLRYIVEGKNGKPHTFMPRQELDWLFPSFIWFSQWHTEIMNYPSTYGPSAARAFCEKHAALNPVAVTLQQVDQKDFKPADWLAGKHPLDEEFLDVTTLTRVACPS